MGLFQRRGRLPAEHRPPLERDERMLAWAEVADGGGVVVVSNLGLWLPGRGHRLGWHEIHKVVWSGRELAVTPAELIDERGDYRVVADCPVETYLVLDPGDVPEQVRSRVTRSVVHTTHHVLPAGGVRVVARRVPGVDGLTWTVRYDPGTARDDPKVVAETALLVAHARSGPGQADNG